MKRVAAITFILQLIITTVLSGCAQYIKMYENRISIVCTIFPQYDWIRQILGEKAGDAELTLLQNNRVDMHSYQPSVDDMVKIVNCDLFIYIGGESDRWVDGALKQSVNKNMLVVNLLDILGESAKTEEIVEGMEDGADEARIGSPEDGAEGHGADEEAAFDEHVWLSLKNAQLLCSAIADALSSIDSNNAAEYRNNLVIYNDKLSALDSEYQIAVNSASVKTLLFGDRFPFRYLTDDYGLNYYAAFAGCSAETEASFETIVFLAEKTDALGLENIIVTESSDKKIAETIIRESKDSNRQILVLDSMQSATVDDIANGATYLSIMKSNLNVLKEAMQEKENINAASNLSKPYSRLRR